MCKIPEYSNLEEKKKYFKTYQPTSGKFTIDTKEEYDEFYESFSQEDRRDKEIIFRGVKEAKYKMYTSVQREFIQNPKLLKKEGERYEQPVEFVMDEIKSLKDDKRFTTYYEALGIQVTDFLCLSFLQHYGAPTPFLDFTYNIDKALYFATEGELKKPCFLCEGKIEDYISIYWIDFDEIKEFCEYVRFSEIVQEQVLKMCEDYEDEGKSILGKDDFESGEAFIYYGKRDQNGELVKDVGLVRRPFSYLKTKNPTKEDQFPKTKPTLKDPVRQICNRRNRVRSLSEVIKFTNPNLIAQEGCFISYEQECLSFHIGFSDKNDGTTMGALFEKCSLQYSMEEALLKHSGEKIYCANIHKSLVPYIIAKNKVKGICKETIFPDMKAIAKASVPKR